jgi:uncharacterized DUF497 family protein
MREISFAWDERKNQQNRRTHGISFEEAQSVFFDEEAVHFFDPDHSDDEDRFLLIGRSYRLRVVLLCHCFRESDRVIRIISARRATRAERSVYQRGQR